MQGSVATRADAIRQTVQVVKDTLADFAKTGPTQQQLDDAKTYLTGSFPLAFASNSGTAAQLGTFQRQNLDIGYVARRNALIQAVTLADVKRVAQRLYDPARLTVVIGGSPAAGTPTAPRPAQLPPGAPVKAPAAAPASKPADKSPESPLPAPQTANKAPKKP
jgi:zinc protease